MDFTYSKEAEDFRVEVRAWLDENLTDELQGFTLQADLNPELLGKLRAWNQQLADAGYAAISWPEAYGGRGASVLEQVVFSEEMSRANAPGPVNPIGINNIAPAIMAYGSEEQKQTLLPRMMRGDDIWCQGFSEPNAGSDLASLRMAAVEDGDDFVLNGHKVWNTLGEFADYCELLVRTDPEAPKHAGISCLLVDMHMPGIDVRPLVTITGGNEFSEIFFDNVRVPKTSLLGPLNGGWMVAMATLTYERAGVAPLHLGVRKKIQHLINDARETIRNGKPVTEDPVARQHLAHCYMMGEHLKMIADRAISAAVNNQDPGAESSLVKIAWSEAENEIAETAGHCLGAAANSARWGNDRVYVRATSIAGGTTQVNRNIIARRVLGLPKAT